MRTRETVLFKSLTIGEDKAFKDRLAKELEVVRKAEIRVDWKCRVLSQAFVWADAPQGADFWLHLSVLKEFQN